jgi:hypothetical protein
MEAEYVAAARSRQRNHLSATAMLPTSGHYRRPRRFSIEIIKQAMTAASFSSMNDRAKHIDIVYHFMRERGVIHRNPFLFVAENR